MAVRNFQSGVFEMFTQFIYDFLPRLLPPGGGFCNWKACWPGVAVAVFPKFNPPTAGVELPASPPAPSPPGVPNRPPVVDGVTPAEAPNNPPPVAPPIRKNLRCIFN